MGITLAIFSLFGNFPVCVIWFAISESGWLSSFLSSLMRMVLIESDDEVVFLFRLSMILMMSCGEM